MRDFFLDQISVVAKGILSHLSPYRKQKQIIVMYAQLIVFLIVVLRVGLGPDVVVLVSHWCLLGTPRSARLCGW